MATYYAVQVLTGQEVKVLNKINFKKTAGLVKDCDFKVCHFSVTAHIKRGKKKVRFNKPLLPGYILIKTNKITTNLYHFLKSFEEIKKVFISSPIEQHEIDRMSSKNIYVIFEKILKMRINKKSIFERLNKLIKKKALSLVKKGNLIRKYQASIKLKNIFARGKPLIT